jgi:hypothetical protein
MPSKACGEPRSGEHKLMRLTARQPTSYAATAERRRRPGPRSLRSLGRPVFRGRAFTTCSTSHLLHEAKELAALRDRDFMSRRGPLFPLRLIGHMVERGYGVSRLDGIQAKLDRAEEQIGALKDFPSAWASREKPYEFTPEIDEGKRRYIWSLVVRKPIPPTAAVIGDEIVHHLRSVLDHLAGYLVESCGDQPTRATGWPFQTSRWGWKRKVERRQRPWQLWREGRRGPLPGIPRDGAIWAFIESTQLHKSGRKARDDLLYALNESWNANKHRILNDLWLEAEPEGDPLDLFDVVPDIEPVESRWIIKPGDELKTGTTIAIFHFPQSAPLPYMQVKMNAQFRTQIVLGNPDDPGHNIDETLKIIRSLVSRATALVSARGTP